MKVASEATIALIDERGFPRASTISSLRTDGISRAWFTTSLRSGKARCLSHSNRASLCYRDGDHNVTLMGTIEILTDEPTRGEFWRDEFIHHYSGGVDDPIYCILLFTADQAVLWVDYVYRELGSGELAACLD